MGTLLGYSSGEITFDQGNYLDLQSYIHCRIFNLNNRDHQHK
jgi:hypothetical protein